MNTEIITYCFLITSNFLEKNIYANFLTRCDDACVITPYLFIYLWKKTNALSVDSSRPICLLTSIYKLYAILVFQKVCDRAKEFVSWTQAGFIHGRS